MLRIKIKQEWECWRRTAIHGHFRPNGGHLRDWEVNGAQIPRENTPMKRGNIKIPRIFLGVCRRRDLGRIGRTIRRRQKVNVATTYHQCGVKNKLGWSRVRADSQSNRNCHLRDGENCGVTDWEWQRCSHVKF
jgi:hypothetical protein